MKKTIKASFSTSMPCPVCGSVLSKVTEKRNVENYVFRRRECDAGHRYKTMEIEENNTAVKKKGSVDVRDPEFAEKLKTAMIHSIDYRKFAQLLYIN